MRSADAIWLSGFCLFCAGDFSPGFSRRDKERKKKELCLKIERKKKGNNIQQEKEASGV